MIKTIAQTLASLLVGRSLADAPTPAAAPAIWTRPYFVTNSREFPNLPLPSRSLVFRNGLFQTEGIDYDARPGSTFRFRPGVLDDLDRVAVVTIP